MKSNAQVVGTCMLLFTRLVAGLCQKDSPIWTPDNKSNESDADGGAYVTYPVCTTTMGPVQCPHPIGILRTHLDARYENVSVDTLSQSREGYASQMHCCPNYFFKRNGSQVNQWLVERPNENVLRDKNENKSCGYDGACHEPWYRCVVQTNADTSKFVCEKNLRVAGVGEACGSKIAACHNPYPYSTNGLKVECVRGQCQLMQRDCRRSSESERTRYCSDSPRYTGPNNPTDVWSYRKCATNLHIRTTNGQNSLSSALQCRVDIRSDSFGDTSCNSGCYGYQQPAAYEPWRLPFTTEADCCPGLNVYPVQIVQYNYSWNQASIIPEAFDERPCRWICPTGYQCVKKGFLSLGKCVRVAPVYGESCTSHAACNELTKNKAHLSCSGLTMGKNMTPGVCKYIEEVHSEQEVCSCSFTDIWSFSALNILSTLIGSGSCPNSEVCGGRQCKLFAFDGVGKCEQTTRHACSNCPTKETVCTETNSLDDNAAVRHSWFHSALAKLRHILA